LPIHNFLPRYSKKGLLGVIIAGIVLILFFVNNTPVKADSYSITLNYNTYYAIFSEGKMDTTGSIYWSYSTTNYVDLEVWILDDANFDIYESGGSATGSPQSETINYFDSGTFNIPHEDKWYVIFINADESRMSSTLASITVTFTGVKGFSDQTATIAIVAAVIVIAAIAIPVSISNKKKKEQAASQVSINQQPTNAIQQPSNTTLVQPIQTQTQPPKMKYCGYCGNANNPGSRFCAYCGADM